MPLDRLIAIMLQALRFVMTTAILVVSDSCAIDPAQDTVGPDLAEILDTKFTATSIDRVPDEKSAIVAALKRLIEEDRELIVCTGGTGFAQRDVTPEAVSSLLERQAPGLVVAMLSKGLEFTPLAALARPVAGTVGNTLILTVPGSPKGAKQSLEAVIEVLPHAIKLLRGTDSTSRELHETGKRSCRHTHSSGASHSVPKFYGNAYRDRSSPYPMIPFDEALKIVLESCPTPKVTSVPIEDAVGSVLAETIRSPMNVPSFRASIVDGYAVLHNDCPGTLPVTEVSTAASEFVEFHRGSCVRITTGAPVPHGVTAVVPVENTVVAKQENGEELEITINAENVQSGDNIREIGSDLSLGSVVLQEGTFLSPLGGEIGTIASVGISKIDVFRRPVVGVMSTGDEVVDVASTCSGSQIFDSNRPMLLANLRAWGTPCVDLGIVNDDAFKLEAELLSALDRCDVVVTSGGVSMGELDLIKPTINRLGGELKFGRVKMKPGKPITFATFPDDKALFGLPGNPASASVCFTLFVLPYIEKYLGGKPHANKVKVVLDFDARLDPRPHFYRANVRLTDKGWLATSTGFQRSSCVKSMASANAFLCLPADSTVPPKTLPKGSSVEAILLNNPY